MFFTLSIIILYIIQYKSDIDPILLSCVVHIFFVLMTTIRAHESFIPFTLPLLDDGHVNVSKDFLSLRFNLQIGTMYLEQEMYFADGEVYETILVQKKLKRC